MKPAWVFASKESFLQALKACKEVLEPHQFEGDAPTRTIKFDCIRSEEIYSASQGSQRGSNVLRGNFPKV